MNKVSCHRTNITVTTDKEKLHVTKGFPLRVHNFLQESCSFVSQNRLMKKSNNSMIKEWLFSLHLMNSGRIIHTQIINKAGLFSAAN